VRALGTFFKIIGVIATLLLVLGLGTVLMTGQAIQVQDAPQRADAIIVLGGDIQRAPYGAKLYSQGYAPGVWISRTISAPGDKLLHQAGIPIPPEYEIYRRLISMGGVPDKAIHLYGHDLLTTSDEAETFGQEFPKAKRIIIVTSPYHVFRAKLIFQRLLPHVEVLGVATPDEFFPVQWWTDKTAAVKVVLETIKLAWFAAGGRF